MTATQVLHRVLSGQTVPAALVTDELRRMVLLAGVLHSDMPARPVMRPRARSQLRTLLLIQAAIGAPPCPQAPQEDPSGAARAVSRRQHQAVGVLHRRAAR